MTRGCNTYGLGQHAEKLIPKLICQACMGRDLPLYGDGRQRREWLAVTDHVAAIIHLMSQSCRGVYNIGNGVYHANRDVAEKILSCVPGATSEIRHVADRKGHDRKYAVTAANYGQLAGGYVKSLTTYSISFVYQMRHHANCKMNDLGVRHVF